MMKMILHAFTMMLSVGIIIGQIISYINVSICSVRIISVSFIVVGIGALLFGIHMVKKIKSMIHSI